MPLIEYKNITKEYEPDRKVLDNVSFKVDKGEFLFVVGPSGAGKSTIVKLLILEELPSKGNILFAGLPQVGVEEGMETSLVDNDNLVSILELPRELIPELRRRIGVVFQDFKLLKSKNVFENVAVALEVGNSSESEVKEVVPNVLGLVGLADKAENFPKELSGGEIQRLSIARALAHEPDVLVADEPTGMIDPESAEEVLRVLDKINSLGTTVIMATHDDTIVDKMKKRVIRIEEGKIISDKAGGKYHE